MTRILTPDSMLYWYPLIKDLPISQPRTEMVMLEKEEIEVLCEAVPKSVTQKVQKVIDEKFSLPVFLRTDLASGKHGWKDTCFYDGTQSLWKHIFHIAEFNNCADIMGLPYRAFVVREYIPMASRFMAFYGDMPVSPERRYFVKNGEIICHHPYWILEAIEQSKPPNVNNWRELAEQMNKETPEEITKLTFYSRMVSRACPGFWLVDFCQRKGGQFGEGKWILIDMATAENSWHPENCDAIKLTSQTAFRSEEK